MTRSDSCLPRSLLALSVGLFGGIFSACTVGQTDEPPPASSPQVTTPEPEIPAMAQVRLYGQDPSWPVPADFPVMLGCTDEEISHHDPLVQEQSVKLCEAAQLGLYDLSQDPTLTAEDAQELGSILMGTTLEKLVLARESSDAGPPEDPDGGAPPADAGPPPPADAGPPPPQADGGMP